jgi:hypothetical protein
MKPGDLLLAARIVLTIPYVWLRVRLLPLPRALAGLMPRKGSSALRAPRSVWVVRLRRNSTRRGATLRTRSPERGARSEIRSEATRIVRLADRILEQRVALLRPSCMLRSLVLLRFLREAGLPVRVQFGVAREGADLKGHSWLTLDGLPFAEQTDPSLRFQIVYSFPEE